MPSLNVVSDCLSYTDYIPVFNLPSGLAHLACGISEAIYGPEAQAAAEEDFESLTFRKLDDWTHLTKAIAILSVIGILFLWMKRIEICSELDYVRGSLLWPVGQGQTFNVDTIPERLFADREWVEAAVRLHNGRSAGEIFARAPEQLMGNVEWISTLVDQRIFKPAHFPTLSHNLQSDRTLVLKMLSITGGNYHGEYVFARLPEALKGDPAIINAAFATAKRSSSTTRGAAMIITPSISDKTVYSRCDEELSLAALAEGIINFQDLSNAQRANYRFCLAAVKRNHKCWGELSPEMRKNGDLLSGLKGWFIEGRTKRWGDASSRSYLWVSGVMQDAEWFRQFQPKGSLAGVGSFESYFD